MIRTLLLDNHTGPFCIRSSACLSEILQPISQNFTQLRMSTCKLRHKLWSRSTDFTKVSHVISGASLKVAPQEWCNLRTQFFYATKYIIVY